jgi:hypothetical protein
MREATGLDIYVSCGIVLVEFGPLFRRADMGAIAAKYCAHRPFRGISAAAQGWRRAPECGGFRSKVASHGRAFINSQTAQSASDPPGVCIASAQHAGSGHQQAETHGD